MGLFSEQFPRFVAKESSFERTRDQYIKVGVSDEIAAIYANKSITLTEFIGYNDWELEALQSLDVEQRNQIRRQVGNYVGRRLHTLRGRVNPDLLYVYILPRDMKYRYGEHSVPEIMRADDITIRENLLAHNPKSFPNLAMVEPAINIIRKRSAKVFAYLETNFPEPDK